MRKIITVLVTVTLLFSSVAFADDSDENDPVRFETFREAVVTMDEGDAYTVSDGFAVAVVNRNGHCYRVVAPFDEHATEIDAAFLEDGEYSNDEFQTLSEYARTLPVQYTEELAVIPFTQDELDTMTGKSIEEVMSEPWELDMYNYPEDAEAGKDIVFPMVKGFCEYELTINESYEDYQKRRDSDRYDPITIMSLRNYLDLTVKSVKYTGISTFHAIDLRYQADGTIEREPFPEDYDYDLMNEIADKLNDLWKDENPNQEAKESMMAKLTEEHPEAAEMIRQIVESFH